MRVASSIAILILSVLAVYPLLMAVAITLDMLAGDGGAYHYIFASTNLRLSMNEIVQDWINSLPLSFVIVAIVLSVSYAAHRMAATSGIGIVIYSSGIIAAFFVGIYIGTGLWSGLLYAICAAVLAMMTFMAIRMQVGGHRSVE